MCLFFHKNILEHLLAVTHTGFPEGGGVNQIFDQFLAKSCMKMKKFWPGRESTPRSTTVWHFDMRDKIFKFELSVMSENWNHYKLGYRNGRKIDQQQKPYFSEESFELESMVTGLHWRLFCYVLGDIWTRHVHVLRPDIQQNVLLSGLGHSYWLDDGLLFHHHDPNNHGS